MDVFDVFISYARENQSHAALFRELLEDEGGLNCGIAIDLWLVAYSTKRVSSRTIWGPGREV